MANNTSHTGTYHLADNPALFEVQRNNNFEFIVTDLNGIQRAGTTGAESNAFIGNAQEMLRLSVTKAFIPHFSQEVVPIKRGNSTLKYAGVPTFEAGTVEFNDFVGADTKSILMAWQNLFYNVDNEKVGSVSNPNTQYKKNCYLVEYTPDCRKIRTWILYGCWISKLQEGDYSAEDGGKHQISATIEYDHAKIDLSDTI
jgi:hypothetical protein